MCLGGPRVPPADGIEQRAPEPGRPGLLTVTAEVRTQGEHLTVCEADVQQDGKALVHAVAFAVLHR